MENGNRENIGFNFLDDEQFEKYFADLNIKLLSGKHIHYDDYNLFSLIEDNYDPLYNFYKSLYKLNLTRETFDNSTYYYLDFFDSGSKGKLSDSSRHKVLTELQTITGLMLLNMYYSKYFDNPKIIRWLDIKREIEEGDQKNNYQRILFGAIRAGYTEKEWGTVERRFINTINSFHELGWVKKLSGQNEELCFELMASIHRMAKLYSKELEDFESFSLHLKAQQEE